MNLIAAKFAGPEVRPSSGAAIRQAVESSSLPLRRRMVSSSAFSLVEVMCAILIMGIGLFGLTQGIATALRSSKDSELQTAAALLAAGQIETTRAEGYVMDGETEGDSDEDGLALYHWKETITATETDGLHEVTVVVENSKSGKAIYELKTLLFDPPLTDSTLTSKDRKDSRNPNKREGGAR